jgi:hypothetical protein
MLRTHDGTLIPSNRVVELPGEGERLNDLIVSSATKLAESTNSDVLLLSGGIDRPYDDKLLDLLAATNKRDNVILFLCTHGGNADAAYRIARGLQENYKQFTVVIAGRCKSAGTLLVIGAHEIAMTAHAELGPLDVQLGKKDELFELDSGLTVLDSLSELEEKAFDLFERAMLRIKMRSGGTVTFKTATHIATELAKGIIAPIMSQIDPMHVGEVSRALKIGKEYGERLGFFSMNLHDDALVRLVEKYPSHGFVIDRSEAEELFLHVRDASKEEKDLIDLKPLMSAVRIPSYDEPTLSFLSEARKEAASGISDAQIAGSGSDSEKAGSSSIEEVSGSENAKGVKPPDGQPGSVGAA